MKLERLRKQIDEVDSEIVRLLNLRCALSREAGILKTRANLPIIDSRREEQVLRSVCLRSADDADNDSISAIYSVIIRVSRDLQTESAKKPSEKYLTI